MGMDRFTLLPQAFLSQFFTFAITQGKFMGWTSSCERQPIVCKDFPNEIVPTFIDFHVIVAQLWHHHGVNGIEMELIGY
jgi:hypothetical protein